MAGFRVGSISARRLGVCPGLPGVILFRPSESEREQRLLTLALGQLGADSINNPLTVMGLIGTVRVT